MARHRIRGKSRAKMLDWRKKQPRESIMRTETFSKIEKGAVKKYGKERASKIAGRAYWNTVKAKFKESQEKK